MNDELEQRLRAYGSTIDTATATDLAERHEHVSETSVKTLGSSAPPDRRRQSQCWRSQHSRRPVSSRSRIGRTRRSMRPPQPRSLRHPRLRFVSLTVR